MAKINVLNKEITLYTRDEEDYICLTDIARYKNSDRTDDLIRNWLRNRNTIEFLGIWEHLNNPNFKPVEFDGFKKQAGLNSLYTGITKDVESHVSLHNAWPELNTRGPDGRLSLYIVKWSATVCLLCGESVRSGGCDLLRKES